MTLTQLKYFRTLCLHKTFSAAAQHLHISQPSLSNAIKELEKEFSVTLFIRQSKGVILTDAAQTLFEMSANLLASSEKCENIMKDMGKGRNILRLGIPPMIGSVMLADIYRDFLSLHPEIKLDITEMGQHDLIKSIQDGFVDMAILPHNRPLDNKLESKKIRKFEIVCCVSYKNPVSSYSQIEPAMLKNTPLVYSVQNLLYINPWQIVNFLFHKNRVCKFNLLYFRYSDPCFQPFLFIFSAFFDLFF